jgi:hypothetical protein
LLFSRRTRGGRAPLQDAAVFSFAEDFSEDDEDFSEEDLSDEDFSEDDFSDDFSEDEEPFFPSDDLSLSFEPLPPVSADPRLLSVE